MPVAQFLNRFLRLYGRRLTAFTNLAEKRSKIVFLLLSILILTTSLAVNKQVNSRVYVVYLDGVELGPVSDARLVEQFVDELVLECSALYDMELQLGEQIEIVPEFRAEYQAAVDRQVEDQIRQKASFLAPAFLLHINGKPVVPLASEKDLEEIVNSLKNLYSRSSESICDIYIVEELELESCQVDPEYLVSPAEVIDLFHGQGGGSAGLTASRELNTQPDLEVNRGSVLSRGIFSFQQESSDDEATAGNLTVQAIAPEQLEPLSINVQTVEEITVIEEIPFDTDLVEDAKLTVNQTEIISEGAAGEKEVTYQVIRENGFEIERIVLDEAVLVEPVNQVEAQGTRPAAVPSGGTFIWPVQGEGIIYNGYRPGHLAIDIHIDQGTNVLAAADGVVTFNGWGSTQGNYLVVHHGDYWTLYLHNSVNLVNQGERVKRGQVIAKVGATGRATGSHLHFEVRIDDGTRQWHSYYQHEPVNPLQFYNR